MATEALLDAPVRIGDGEAIAASGSELTVTVVASDGPMMQPPIVMVTV